MAQATDEQMQAYADQRIRVRAEQCRALMNALADDQLAIPDIWDRAANGSAWADNRTDGPPTLLESSDVLSFNIVSALLLKCVAGTADTNDIASLAANWPTFQAACVRPVSN